MIEFYKPANPNLWQGRNDPEAADKPLHWHQTVQFLDLENSGLKDDKQTGKTAFLGYACEVGVARNNGRIGAAQGPDAIRKQLAKLPINVGNMRNLFDAGTVFCYGDALESTQEITANYVSNLLGHRFLPILLGGGHDMAWAHFCGISKFLQQFHPGKTIGILNFDAHFDLRKPIRFGHSGTPFYQIKQRCDAHQKPFHYLCLGIQRASNSQILFDRAKAWQVDFVEAAECNLTCFESLEKRIQDFLSKVDCIYLTVDLDVFSSAFAPGVSAPSPMGIDPNTVVQVLQMLKKSKKLISVDFAELNPAFDLDNRTASLAARLIHHLLH
ncbi:MAG: formimidoylglutamase [Flavobacteriales bacterium CG_4_9_14_3_um_filter_40_17]|nr:MAG: formimidoylglutamase [Flavobacteriales bacterium CG_4_9_14_3_um_filter_40_17]